MLAALDTVLHTQHTRHTHTLITGILTLLQVVTHPLAIPTVDIRRLAVTLHLLPITQYMEVTNMVWGRFLPEVLRPWRQHMELTTRLTMAMDTTIIITMASLNTTSSSVRSLVNAGSIEGCLASTRCGNDLIYFTCVSFINRNLFLSTMLE